MTPQTPLVTPRAEWTQATTVAAVKAKGHKVVTLSGQTIALFYAEDQIYAIDNRCPHMGFPLQGGPCKDGIVTCPWHYARFDLASGGTFDSWADDVRAFPVEIRGDEVWVDLTLQMDPQTHQEQRLRDGLEQQISLVIAKSAIALLDLGTEPADIFKAGLDFGCRYSEKGWGSGLTIHTCLMNLLPYLDSEDQPLALYQGLAAVARDSSGAPPRFGVHPLPGSLPEFPRLKQWFCGFIERRDHEAAERCIASAVNAKFSREQIAELLFSAATDHRYLDGGHTMDFINKALEALDGVQWQGAQAVLTSLIPGMAKASRMEERNAWRYPVDLVAILERAFDQIPEVLAAGQSQRRFWTQPDDLVSILMGDNPEAIADCLLDALRQGCSPEQLASIATYTAALRVAQFHTINDHRDWNSAHHPFTYAHAIHQAVRRVPTPELVRGIFDAAFSVYLNRFLNVPAARLPDPQARVEHPEELLNDLPDLLNRQQQVNEIGRTVALYLQSGGDPQQLMATLGKLMLRENREFHVIQELEAAFRQYSYLGNSLAGVHVLVAASRYLAAHAPTRRSQYQTYETALRLHQGDRLFES